MATKHEASELSAALYAIKDECDYHGSSCFACPLYRAEDNKCGITGQKTYGIDGDYQQMPRFWNILDVKLMAKPTRFD